MMLLRREAFARELLGPAETTIHEGHCCAALVAAVQMLCGSIAHMRANPGLSLPSTTDTAPMLLYFTRHGGWTLLRMLLRWRMSAAAAVDGCALDGVVGALLGCHLASPADCERGAPATLRLASQLLTLPGVWAAAPVLHPHMARYVVVACSYEPAHTPCCGVPDPRFNSAAQVMGGVRAKPARDAMRRPTDTRTGSVGIATTTHRAGELHDTVQRANGAAVSIGRLVIGKSGGGGGDRGTARTRIHRTVIRVAGADAAGCHAALHDPAAAADGIRFGRRRLRRGDGCAAGRI
jgi:hypothetical protein